MFGWLFLLVVGISPIVAVSLNQSSLSSSGSHGAIATEVSFFVSLYAEIIMLLVGRNMFPGRPGPLARGWERSGRCEHVHKFLFTLLSDRWQIIGSSLCVGVVAAYHSGIGGGGFLLCVL